MARDLSSQGNVDPQVVVEAIESLRSKGWEISPYSVADEAQIPRSALFRNAELMALITQAQAGAVAESADSVSEVDGKVASLERIIHELESWNKELEHKILSLETAVLELASLQKDLWNEVYQQKLGHTPPAGSATTTGAIPPEPDFAPEPVRAEAPAEPVSSEPVSSEPVPSEPVPSEPVPSEPAPSEPAPGPAIPFPDVVFELETPEAEAAPPAVPEAPAPPEEEPVVASGVAEALQSALKEKHAAGDFPGKDQAQEAPQESLFQSAEAASQEYSYAPSDGPAEGQDFSALDSQGYQSQADDSEMDYSQGQGYTYSDFYQQTEDAELQGGGWEDEGEEGAGEADDKQIDQEELRDLLKLRFGKGGEEGAGKDEAGKKIAGTKFVGGAKAGQDPPPNREFVIRNVPPDIRKCCLILGLRPEELTHASVHKAWKKEISNPGGHPDIGGETEIAVYLNTAKDTLFRFLDAQAPKLGKKFGSGARTTERAAEKAPETKPDSETHAEE